MKTGWIIAFIIFLILLIPVVFLFAIFRKGQDVNSAMPILGWTMLSVNIILLLVTGFFGFKDEFTN